MGKMEVSVKEMDGMSEKKLVEAGVGPARRPSRPGPPGPSAGPEVPHEDASEVTTSPTEPSDAAAPVGPGEAVDRRLRDVVEGQPHLRLTARVLTAERREVPRKDGKSKIAVLSGLLSDGSATMRFTWWDPPQVEVERGTVLRVTNPQVRRWKERREVSFGWKTQVELASEMELPRMEDEEFVVKRLGELRSGDEGFRLTVHVLFSEPRTLTIGERHRVVHGGIVCDGTGRMPFTAWTDLELTTGTNVEIFGACARDFRDEMQLVLDERSRVERREDVPDLGAGPGPVEIGLLEEGVAIGRPVVEGIVVEVRSPSGLVHRCEQCSRSLAKGMCRQHGSSKGVPDLRARLVVDDGTGSLTVQLGRPLVEQLLGWGLPQALELAREKLDASAVEEHLSEVVLGRRLRLLGRAVPGDWGITLFADLLLPTREAADAEAARLLTDPQACRRSGP